MPELFWSILRIGGYLALFLLSLALTVALAGVALFTVAAISMWRDDRRKARTQAAENAAMHERIHAFLRQQLTTQE